MATSLSALLLAGGFGTIVAFCAGLAFATTAARVLALAALGALLACSFQAGVLAHGVGDALLGELLNAVGTANALGWFAGTLLVARLRALEWLDQSDELSGFDPTPAYDGSPPYGWIAVRGPNARRRRALDLQEAA